MLYTNLGHGDKILSSSQQNRFFESALLWLGRQPASSAGSPAQVR
jgi:hypothetical protein